MGEVVFEVVEVADHVGGDFGFWGGLRGGGIGGAVEESGHVVVELHVLFGIDGEVIHVEVFPGLVLGGGGGGGRRGGFAANDDFAWWAGVGAEGGVGDAELGGGGALPVAL